MDLKLATEKLLLASVQRISDRAFALRHVELSTVLEAVPEGESALSEVRAVVWPLFERIDGRRTLKDAIALTRLDDFEAAKTACAMLFLGIVRRKAGTGPELDLAEQAQSGLGEEAMYTVPLTPVKVADLPTSTGFAFSDATPGYTETRAEALTGVPGYTPQVMPSGDLARWLESVSESQKALEGFFAGLGPNQGRLESDLWDPIEDALRSASPQQTAALQLAQTMVGTKAKPYMSAALDYIIGLLKEPNANQWLNEWWQSRGGPGFQEGGTVPRTGLYMLHRGEEVTPAGGATYHITIENHGVMTTPSQTKRLLREVITDINRERVGRRSSIENTAFQGLS